MRWLGPPVSEVPMPQQVAAHATFCEGCGFWGCFTLYLLREDFTCFTATPISEPRGRIDG